MRRERKRYIAKGQTKGYENLDPYDGYLAWRLLKIGEKTIKELSDRELVAYAYWIKGEDDFFHIMCNAPKKERKEALSLMREALTTGTKFHCCKILHEGVTSGGQDDEEFPFSSDRSYAMWLTDI